ncbi:MAG: hypothetical protein ACOZNI_16085 [Myxococcota bacterium]
MDCGELQTPPERFQVAWVSPVRATVGAGAALDVVRVADLRKLIEARRADPLAVLQALGLAGKRDAREWKVTVFDVERAWLCRPVDAVAGDDVAGVRACDEGWQRPGRGTREKAWTGCGWLKDTQTGERTLDVYRLDWEAAVRWGFCVLPMGRFLGGS